MGESLGGGGLPSTLYGFPRGHEPTRRVRQPRASHASLHHSAQEVRLARIESATP